MEINLLTELPKIILITYMRLYMILYLIPKYIVQNCE